MSANSVSIASKSVVSISIDVSSASPAANGARRKAALGDKIENVAEEILARFKRHGIPATCAFENPLESKLAASIGRQTIKHEIALLCGAIQELSRAEFVAKVIRPMQSAGERMQPISTLSLRAPWQPQHLDLLVKHGVSIVRAAQAPEITHARTVCYGMWNIAPTATIRGGGWMANQTQGTVVQRALHRAGKQQGASTCHLRIDTAAIAAGDVAGALRNIDRMLAQVNALQTSGVIEIETLRQTAVRLQPKRLANSARSILRAA